VGNLIRRHPLGAYFALTFLISWMGALAVVAPYLMRHSAVPKMVGLMMFPVMLLGPSCSSIILTSFLNRSGGGLSDLFRRMRRVSVGYWYITLLIPLALVLIVLCSLKTFVSPVFAPNAFLIGIAFGLPAGFFEEIGWMGYAFPRMRDAMDPLKASIVLGLLWSVWHIPVIDYLGTATPHGNDWLPFFLAFAAAMTAMRVIIGWVYMHTGSVLLAQLLHAISTGSLVIFSPPRASAGQEAFWYAVYAGALWLAVIAICRGLTRNPRRPARATPHAARLADPT
jgi:membrane protease YdiL (CAAX protease family)